MQGKPRTYEGYERGQVELVLMTCRELSTVLGDFIKDEVLPNERNALNLFDAGTRAGDQVRVAVAQIESILTKWFGD